jgi:hypothetical protein
MTPVKPISPKEADEKQIANIPDFIIEAANELIASNIGDSNSVDIYQKDIVELALKKAPEGMTSSEIFKKKWMDIESLFRKAGWTVRYDKPAYCESYEPYFTFTKKRLKRKS